MRGHFPTEQAALKTLYLVTRGMDPKGTGQARWAVRWKAALKTLYLVTRGLDPKGTGQARWAVRWKPALNAFAVTFADRMPAAENL